ncbi:MAG TPA: hypothetical protein VI756_32680 [Blastocatellia bacterium]
MSTRISFQEPVAEIICGDLYDAATGRGSFVLQRGDRDVFIKPIPPKGMSNLFVKTGDHGEHIYNFDLAIVPSNEALRVVNVLGASTSAGEPRPALGVAESEIQVQARKKADDTIRQAEADAAEIVAAARRGADAITSQAMERAQNDLNRRFVNALMLGLRQQKTVPAKVTAPNGVSITLDPEVIFFGDKSYLRYSIHNDGAKDFSVSDLSVEDGSGKTVSADIVAGKNGNIIKPGESSAGVIAFDSVHKTRIVLSVRGEGNTEIAHLGVNL